VVCEANGITQQQLVSKADQVEHLEMFLFNFPRMLSLGTFSNLSSLSVMQQSIQTLEGLDQCHHLKTLWVIESQVRVGRACARYSSCGSPTDERESRLLRETKKSKYHA
jgi:hypothetical protein